MRLSWYVYDPYYNIRPSCQQLKYFLAYGWRFGDMCEEKMLNPKGTGGDIVMKMIDDANNLMVVRFFNLFDTLHLLQRVFDKNPKL